MFMTLKRDWEAISVSNNSLIHVVIPAGRHEIERVPHPFGRKNVFWLVLKGTLTGAAEGSWRQWRNGSITDNPDHPNFGKPINWGDYEVVIEE